MLLSEPLVINDNSFPMDDFIDAIDADIQYNGKLVTAANALIEKLDAYYAA